MMLMAETRPSSRGGVTACRKVVVEITHRIGPAPSRKKPRPASSGLATNVVSASTSAATKPVTGPSAIAVRKLQAPQHPRCGQRAGDHADAVQEEAEAGEQRTCN